MLGPQFKGSCKVHAYLTRQNSFQQWTCIRSRTNWIEILTYTSAIGISLQLLSLGSQGRVERQLGRQGGELRGIREAINLLLAKRNAVARDESRPEDQSPHLYIRMMEMSTERSEQEAFSKQGSQASEESHSRLRERA